jgi:hypothetical protein
MPLDAHAAARSPTPCRLRRSAGEPITALLAIDGPIALTDITELCTRVTRALRDCYASVVLCDVGALRNPDLVSIEALARMQLTAVRLGGQIRLCHASTEMQGLLAVTGLCEVLSNPSGSLLQVSGQTEQREEGLGVEECVDRSYPPP